MQHPTTQPTTANLLYTTTTAALTYTILTIAGPLLIFTLRISTLLIIAGALALLLSRTKPLITRLIRKTTHKNQPEQPHWGSTETPDLPLINPK